jgi:hypothetical protein
MTSAEGEDASPLRQALRAPEPDAVAHRRELGRRRSKRHRQRLSLYGEAGSGYVITQRVTPGDYLDKLAGRFPAIAEAKQSGDKEELGRALDWLEAAVAEGTLASFEEDYEPGKLVV